jgi:hydrogenase expression/formation protein HypC
MCLAVPLQVLRMEGSFAICRGVGGEQRIDTLLTGPLEPGQWVLSFLDAAREVVDAERAEQVRNALAGLQSLHGAEGDADALIRAHFPDLVDREPQLPDYLRPAS